MKSDMSSAVTEQRSVKKTMRWPEGTFVGSCRWVSAVLLVVAPLPPAKKALQLRHASEFHVSWIDIMNRPRIAFIWGHSNALGR